MTKRTASLPAKPLLSIVVTYVLAPYGHVYICYNCINRIIHSINGVKGHNGRNCNLYCSVEISTIAMVWRSECWESRGWGHQEDPIILRSGKSWNPWMHSPMVCTALIAVSNPLVSSKPIHKRNGRLPRVDFDFSYAWMGVFALDTCQRDG